MQNDVLVSVKGVSRFYGTSCAVDNISSDAGEIVLRNRGHRIGSAETLAEDKQVFRIDIPSGHHVLNGGR